jgi:hypothetical protein
MRVEMYVRSESDDISLTFLLSKGNTQLVTLVFTHIWPTTPIAIGFGVVVLLIGALAAESSLGRPSPLRSLLRQLQVLCTV